MNIKDLRAAQVRFETRIEAVLTQRKELYDLRSDFVAYFELNKIKTMKINEYVIGRGAPESGYNFCYSLERDLDGLGRLIGATAFKFGVFYSKDEQDYRFTKKFGQNHIEVFKNVKNALIELLKYGEKNNIEGIINNPISPMFKGKILSTYFPDRYLNVFLMNI
jgi:hypothetical protein